METAFRLEYQILHQSAACYTDRCRRHPVEQWECYQLQMGVIFIHVNLWQALTISPNLFNNSYGSSTLTRNTYRSSPCRAFSMASGSWERNKSCVTTGEPRHKVDRRLITVDMLGLDLESAGDTTTGPERIILIPVLDTYKGYTRQKFMLNTLGMIFKSLQTITNV